MSGCLQPLRMTTLDDDDNEYVSYGKSRASLVVLDDDDACVSVKSSKQPAGRAPLTRGLVHN